MTLPAPTLPYHADSLAERLRAGDAEALVRLADATFGRALAVARSLGADERTAERVVLDAYVSLWCARAETPADGRLEAWVFTAVGALVAPVEREPGRVARGWAGVVRAVGAAWRRLGAPTGTARRAATARGCAGLA